MLTTGAGGNAKRLALRLRVVWQGGPESFYARRPLGFGDNHQDDNDREK